MLFVSFEPDNSTYAGVIATSTATQGKSFVLFIDTLPSTTCTLSAPGHTLPLGKSPDEAMDPGAPSFLTRWGKDWAVGPSTVTVTCTWAGQTARAYKDVSITAP